MIKYLRGNLLESDAEALVNTVNTVGVMGKGIALQFKQTFPDNTRQYVKAFKEGKLEIGKLLIVKASSLHTGEKTIINFPTKNDWRKPSKYHFIELGLIELVKFIKEENIKSVAIPPLGAGNGGLIWTEVKKLLEHYLSDVDCHVYIYEPSKDVSTVLKQQRVKLTPARAMLLYVLYDLVRYGEFVSEFSAEKIAYFLQRMGASDAFKLTFSPNFYGPYSGKVRHILHYLNGSYIFGFDSKDSKPFEELGIVLDAERDVLIFLEKEENSRFLSIANETKEFLKGYYSSYSLELLSTVDFIATNKKTRSHKEIVDYLKSWSERKRTLSENSALIDLAIEKVLTLNT